VKNRRNRLNRHSKKPNFQQRNSRKYSKPQSQNSPKPPQDGDQKIFRTVKSLSRTLNIRRLPLRRGSLRHYVTLSGGGMVESRENEYGSSSRKKLYA